MPYEDRLLYSRASECRNVNKGVTSSALQLLNSFDTKKEKLLKKTISPLYTTQNNMRTSPVQQVKISERNK